MKGERPLPTSPRTRRERQRAAFRAEALDAARDAIAAGGLEGLSMRKLAQRLDCAPMSLYSCFRDKHELLASLAQRGYDALARRLDGEHADAPLAALQRTFLAYARHGLEHPDDYRVVFMVPVPRSADASKAPVEVERENPAFAVGLDRARACVDAGVLAGDAHAIATMLWTGVHGAVAAILTFPDFPFGDRDDYLVRVVERAIEALQTASTPPLL